MPERTFPLLTVYLFGRWLRGHDMHKAYHQLNHICQGAPNWAFRDLSKLRRWVGDDPEKLKVLDELVAYYKQERMG